MPEVGDIWDIPCNPYTVLIVQIYNDNEEATDALCLYNTGWSEGSAWWTYSTTQITFTKSELSQRYKKIGHIDISELDKL
jgi:hypothetical protein